MNKKTLNDAIFEAKRFLKRAEDLNKKTTKDWFYDNPKESGSVRRSSMDLTRALAELRKRGH